MGEFSFCHYADRVKQKQAVHECLALLGLLVDGYTKIRALLLDIEGVVVVHTSLRLEGAFNHCIMHIYR
jgi:hypothetical protein